MLTKEQIESCISCTLDEAFLNLFRELRDRHIAIIAEVTQECGSQTVVIFHRSHKTARGFCTIKERANSIKASFEEHRQPEPFRQGREYEVTFREFRVLVSGLETRDARCLAKFVVSALERAHVP